MKERADVYRVRDNQREATLIIVIGGSSVYAEASCNENAQQCVRQRTRELRTQGLKGPTPPSWLRTRVQCVHSRARAHSGCTHVRCNVRYAPLLTSLFAADYVRRGWVDADVDYRRESRPRNVKSRGSCPSVSSLFLERFCPYILRFFILRVYIRMSSSQKIHRYYKCNKLQIFLVIVHEIL